MAVKAYELSLTVALSLQVVLLHAVHGELMGSLGLQRGHEEQHGGDEDDDGKRE